MICWTEFCLSSGSEEEEEAKGEVIIASGDDDDSVGGGGGGGGGGGYSVVEVTATEDGDQKRLKSLLREHPEFDLWGTQRRRGIFQVMIPKSGEPVLTGAGLNFTERIKDVRSVLMRDRQAVQQMGLQDRKVTTDIRKKGIKDFGRFYKLEQLNDYIEYLAGRDDVQHVQHVCFLVSPHIVAPRIQTSTTTSGWRASGSRSRATT